MTYTSKCPPGHRHGEATTCYTAHKCRCTPCKANWNDRNERKRKDQAYGRYQSLWIDAEPARQHVRALQAQGMSLSTIAFAAGIDLSTVAFLVNGRASRNYELAQHVERSTAAAILDTQFSLDHFSNKSTLDARGLVRRMQALVACGWSVSLIGRQLGVSPQRADQLIKLRRTTASSYRRVCALYEELWDQPAPRGSQAERRAFTISISRARANRWAKPLDWDDIDNDDQPSTPDPEAFVDEIAVELAVAGNPIRLNHAEKLEALRLMHPKRWSNGLIAERLGCDERHVNRLRDEIGLAGWDQSELVGKRAA